MAAAQAPSMAQLLRALRRENLSLKHRLLSIERDSRFLAQLLSEVGAARLGWPVLANLRCGAWFVPPELSTQRCYFKSTDGHAGKWTLAASRLNLHVARAAGAHGGAFLVDSTRRGKEFPDSFSRTVPLWCAVLNAALCGRASVAFPSWVPPSEVAQIEARLDEFAARLRALAGADELKPLAASALAARPLRCIWASPTRRLDAQELRDLASRFTLLVCVSVSAPEEEAFADRGGWYYVQGAGDDEESWARGLSPSLLWTHRAKLLDSTLPADEVEQLVDELVSGEAAADQPVRLFRVPGAALAFAFAPPAAAEDLLNGDQTAGFSRVLVVDSSPPPAASARSDDESDPVHSKGQGPDGKDDEVEDSARAVRVSRFYRPAKLTPTWLQRLLPAITRSSREALCADPPVPLLLVSEQSLEVALVAAAAVVLAASPDCPPQDKAAIRACVSRLQSLCPSVFPSRSLAKQLNSFFLSEAPAAGTP